MVKKVNLEEFQKIIEDSETPIVVDCYADWCMPCKYSSPLFEKMSKKYPNARFIKVNVDEEPHIASAFQVRGVPSFYILRGKTVIGSVVGADMKKLESLVEKELKNPTKIEVPTQYR